MPPVSRNRPIPDMTANVNALVDQVRGILDGYQALGEVKIVVDAFNVAGLVTLHIPLPKQRRGARKWTGRRL
jgi:hypothetical protein